MMQSRETVRGGCAALMLTVLPALGACSKSSPPKAEAVVEAGVPAARVDGATPGILHAANATPAVCVENGGDPNNISQSDLGLFILSLHHGTNADVAPPDRAQLQIAARKLARIWPKASNLVIVIPAAPDDHTNPGYTSNQLVDYLNEVYGSTFTVTNSDNTPFVSYRTAIITGSDWAGQGGSFDFPTNLRDSSGNGRFGVFWISPVATGANGFQMLIVTATLEGNHHDQLLYLLNTATSFSSTAVGVYPAIVAGDFNESSGTIATDPAWQDIATRGTVYSYRQPCDNIGGWFVHTPSNVLASNGSPDTGPIINMIMMGGPAANVARPLAFMLDPDNHLGTNGLPGDCAGEIVMTDSTDSTPPPCGDRPSSGQGILANHPMLGVALSTKCQFGCNSSPSCEPCPKGTTCNNSICVTGGNGDGCKKCGGGLCPCSCTGTCISAQACSKICRSITRELSKARTLGPLPKGVSPPRNHP